MLHHNIPAQVVSLVRGVVEITDSRNSKVKTRERFETTVPGVTLDECRSAFKFSKCFKWKEQKAMRLIEDAGRVRLVSFEFVQYLGLQRPTIAAFMDELI